MEKEANRLMKNIPKAAWAAVLIWMAVIFFLSHQPGSESGELSSAITEKIIAAAEQISPALGYSVEKLHTIVRKSAHFAAYLLLGILALNALRKSGAAGFRSYAFAFCIAAGYALTDEFHQLFIPGRSGEMRDVGIDSAGAAAGLLLFWLFRRWFFPKRDSRSIN